MAAFAETWIRVIVGAVFLPCIAYLCWTGGAGLFVFVTLVVLFGLREYHGIASAKDIDPNWFIGVPAAFLLCLDAWLEAGSRAPLILTALLVLTAASEVFRKDAGSSFQNVAATVFGVVYIGLLGSHLILLGKWPAGDPAFLSEGERIMAPALLAFAIPWSYDAFAYFAGRLLGRRKLLPRVSAGKTVEGTIGGLIGAVAFMFGLRYALFPFLSPFHCVVLGVAGSMAAQVGDLVESLIKRDAGLKDSSRIIPGHGGILDRFDSVFFAAPFVYYYLACMTG
jgi:phosphatidate cytidylyltransferase